MRFDELNESNYIMFAIKNYENPQAVTQEDFLWRYEKIQMGETAPEQIQKYRRFKRALGYEPLYYSL